MELDDLKGRSGEPTSTTIDPARVHQYVQAVGDTNPAYPQAPDDAEGKVAPPAFAAVYALFAGGGAMASMGIPPNRLIHGEQAFSWTRPLKVGETVTAQGSIVDVYKKRSLQFVEAEVVVRDSTETEVCRSKATILVLPDPNEAAEADA
ncbi:MAG: MaoC family dehydratase N-terminal domain-containing protein [Candidatus Dormiibacterota bacterium]